MSWFFQFALGARQKRMPLVAIQVKPMLDCPSGQGKKGENMTIFVLRNQGVIVNKKAVDEINSTKDKYNRTIGNILFTSGQSLIITNPLDFELIETNIFLKVENPPILNFDYIEFELERNYIDKLKIKSPVIYKNNDSNKNVNENIKVWIANMYVKIIELLGEE